MSKKYEIVNVGGVNRVRALRSWMVQGRQVNVGDVGGAVFDERTLSQDGDAWIFSGRFDNPLVRVGGDSVVNIGEAAPSAIPFVNIFGTSSLDSNFPVGFAAVPTHVARPLTPAMMEQGRYDGVIGKKVIRAADATAIRKTNRIFTGGAGFSVPAPAEGYAYKMIAVDADDIVTYVTTYLTAPGTVPAGAHLYVYLTVAKSPAAGTVPADVTEAALTFPDRNGATINIVDSHITLTGQNAGYVSLSPSTTNGENTTNIVGSTVNVTRTAGTPVLYFVCDLINTTASINMQATSFLVYGVYKNVKNLVWSGVTPAALQKFRTIVQATDCDNFVMDGINIPVATAIAASDSAIPLVFTRCNMNKAQIVNQPLINNTYEDINFDLASADLGKYTVSSITRLVSSNVNGMYRLREGTGGIGALVETHESVKDLSLVSAGYVAETYNTTIYADAYLKGPINLRGTNVIGGSRSHGERTFDASRMAVQGIVNAVSVGGTISGVTADPNRVCIPLPVNLRTAKGLTISGLSGDLQAAFYCTDAKNVITNVIGWAGDRDLTGVTGAEQPQCYIGFRHSSAATPIKPEDLAGVTITTYSGCKVVNTKATAVAIAGNVRVEDNAVLKDVSVSGSGYFGGESVTEAPTVRTAPLPVEGMAFVRDNAVFSPATAIAGAGVSLLDMSDNSVFAGALNTAETFYNITMEDNARFNGATSTRSGFVMRGNSLVASGCTLVAACKGLLEMEGNARVESGNLTAVGHITLTGDYRQTAAKVWTGKRVIDSQDAPVYDNNVRTKYDF